jgi:hypothetical protein
MAAVARFQQTASPRAPRGPWATLLRVAWLAILLGLLLQAAQLLVAAGFGMAISPRPLLAETLKTLSWSLLVCVGVALGRVAAKGRLPLEGITGLLAAPLALLAANAVHKGVAEAVDAAGVPAGPAPLWVLAVKAAEYACLGLALEWVGRRAWGSALGHLAVGLVTGVVFGGVFLAVVVQSAPAPLSAPSLVARGVNELLFPVGCALVVFIAEVLRTHLDPTTAEDRPLKTSSAAADEPTPDSLATGISSGPGAHGGAVLRSGPRPLGLPQPPPHLPHSTDPGPPHPSWRAPPGLAVLGSWPRTAGPQTHRPSRWSQTGDRTPAAGQAQPAEPSPVGIAVSKGLAHGRHHGLL